MRCGMGTRLGVHHNGPLSPADRPGTPPPLPRESPTHAHSPSLAPSSTPSLQQHAPPPPNAPQGRQNGEGGEETGQGERDEPRRVTGQGRPRSPKTVQSAEEQVKEKREGIIVAVRSPCQENYPADAHPSALKSVLESANPAWTRSVHLDAPGQRHGQQPVSGTANPGVVKQDKSSRGSVDTTKTRSGPQRVRMSSGERPIGAAKGKQSDTEALCQTPPLLSQHARHSGIRRRCICGCASAAVSQTMHCECSRRDSGGWRPSSSHGRTCASPNTARAWALTVGLFGNHGFCGSNTKGRWL